MPTEVAAIELDEGSGAPSAEAGAFGEAARLRDAEVVAAAIRRRRLLRVLPWIVIAGIVAVWEVAARVFDIPKFVLPAPSVIAQSIVTWWYPILINAEQTLKTTLAGFALANVFGLALGVIVGSSTLVYHGLYPLLIAFNSIPKVALVPILVIWFGVGTPPAILTAFLISFFPITVNVAAGIATVEPELRDVLRALGASPLTIVRKVGLPRAMPYYFASLKIAITTSFLGSILAETMAGQSGIGNLMVVASTRFDVPLVFAGVVVTSAMSVIMYTIASIIEKRTISWATRNDGDFDPATGA